MSTAPMLEIRSLSKRFGDANAVDSVQLEVLRGEFVVLLGPSGCGKTTTLRLIAGFDLPTGGEIVLDGRTLSTPRHTIPPEKRNMSMIFQGFAIWPHMTVRQNVAFGPSLQGIGKQERLTRVGRSLEMAQISEYADRYPAELSGGQQQRVSLARALAVKPKLMLMDEPLSNLDEKLRVDMRNELRRLHKEVDFTAVYVTHDQREAMELGDRIVVMRAGRIQQVGNPKDLYERPANEFVAGFLGRANIVDGLMRDNESVRIGRATLPCTTGEGVETDTTVRVVIRPTNIHVVGAEQPAQDGPALSCVIRDVVFVGESNECHLEFPELGQTLRASLPPFPDRHIGGEISCVIRGVVVVATSAMDDADEGPGTAEDVSRVMGVPVAPISQSP